MVYCQLCGESEMPRVEFIGAGETFGVRKQPVRIKEIDLVEAV